MFPTFRSLRPILVAVTAAGCIQCGASSDQGPSTATLAGIQLQPGDVTLAPAATQRFVASCWTSSQAPLPCPALTWQATGGNLQTGGSANDTSGTYTAGATAGVFAVTVSAGAVSALAPVTVSGPGVPANVTLDAAQTFQTMRGWEAHISGGWSTTDAIRNGIIDAAVNRLGITRLRFPAGFTSTGIDWADFDQRMRDWVMPIRSKVIANGDPFILNMDYRGVLPSDSTSYAARVLMVLQHVKANFGIEPEIWTIKNEPDNGAVKLTGTQVGQWLLATAHVLRANGFNKVMFSTPTTMNPNSALTYLNQILAVPGVRQYITEVAYHKYSAPQPGVLAALRDSAAGLNVTTAMLEHHSSDYLSMLQDVTQANTASWERDGLAGPIGQTDYPLFQADDANNTFIWSPTTTFFRQYYRYIRPGMTRIGASASNSGWIPVAFRDPSGKTVVVVATPGAATVSVGGLPAGTYTPSYATASQWNIVGAPITIGAGQTLVTSIPAAGAITIAP